VNSKQNIVCKAWLQEVNKFKVKILLDEEEIVSDTNDADFSYKEVSDISDATEDIQAES